VWRRKIAFAKLVNVPVFGVYIDAASWFTPLPKGLARSRVVPWKWERVGLAIRQCMKQGKNAPKQSFWAGVISSN
jgi:hypothetical protein